MCEKKPGPRCSPETLGDLIAAEREYSNYLLNSSRSGWSSSENDKLKNKVMIRQLRYHATPDGFKALEKDAYDSHQNDTSIKAIIGYFYDEYENKPSEVNFKIPVWKDSEAYLLVAKSHREWQTNALKALQEIETEGDLEKAKSYAEFLVEGLNNELPKLEAKLSLAKDESQTAANNAAESAYYRKTSELTEANNSQVSKVHESFIKERKLQLVKDYAKFKIEDLTSYIDHAEKRLARRVKDSTPVPAKDILVNSAFKY